MIERLTPINVSKLLWSFSAFGYFASCVYSPKLNFLKLSTLTTFSPLLKSNVLDLGRNEKFCEVLRKYIKAF